MNPGWDSADFSLHHSGISHRSDYFTDTVLNLRAEEITGLGEYP